MANYEEKMEAPQRHYFHSERKSFREFFKNDPDALLEPLDLLGNTSIHVAIRSKIPQLVRELLEMLSESDKRRVLTIANNRNYTVLHYASSDFKMVDVLLAYHEELRAHAVAGEIEPKRSLLELKNDLGETPVYRAAKRGNLEVLKEMVKHVDMEKHFRRDIDGTSILHMAIIGQCFGESIFLIALSWCVESKKGLYQGSKLRLRLQL